MAKAVFSSLALPAETASQQTIALKRYRLLRPFLEEQVPLSRIAKEQQISVRTLRRWVTNYRAHSLDGLMRHARKDSGHYRSAKGSLRQVIEALALQKPRRTITNIHREALRLCKEQNWTPPSYATTKRIVKSLDPALTTLAHDGAKAYTETYDLIYRHQASGPNEVWQSDHSLLPVLVRNDQGVPQKPWLTVILDDYSRIVAGYYLSFSDPNTQRTALTLRSAIWHKTDSRWHVCGIPNRFYTETGKTLPVSIWSNPQRTSK
jgi:putative transposase